MMNSGKVLLGFLSGLVSGAILGVLFAPGKGSSTRKKIAHRSDEYLTELGEKFDDFVDSVTKKVDDAKEEAVRLAEKGKKNLEAMDGKSVSNFK
jgi:gas vesicle protein